MVRNITSSVTQSGFASLRVRVRAPVDSSRPFAYGLLDERIEDCGPNRNCYAAVARERNASKPPLEEFLSRFLGT